MNSIFTDFQAIGAIKNCLAILVVTLFICGCETTKDSSNSASVTPPQEQELTESGESTETNELNDQTQTTDSPDVKQSSESIVDFKKNVDEMIRLHKSENFSEAYEMSQRIQEAHPDAVKLDLLHAKTAFAAGHPVNSAEAYDRLVNLDPQLKPRFWQRGISLYYANRFEDGADQFNSHQTFNSQDVENSVWQLMCQAKVTSVEEARKQMIPIEHDRRVGMLEIFKMFAGTGTPEDVLKACKYEPGSKIKKDNDLYHGLLYIGLYHEMVGETEKSEIAINQALEAQPSNDSTMYWIARVHKQLRTGSGNTANDEAEKKQQ